MSVRQGRPCVARTQTPATALLPQQAASPTHTLQTEPEKQNKNEIIIFKQRAINTLSRITTHELQNEPET